MTLLIAFIGRENIISANDRIRDQSKSPLDLTDLVTYSSFACYIHALQNLQPLILQREDRMTERVTSPKIAPLFNISHIFYFVQQCFVSLATVYQIQLVKVKRKYNEMLTKINPSQAHKILTFVVLTTRMTKFVNNLHTADTCLAVANVLTTILLL